MAVKYYVMLNAVTITTGSNDTIIYHDGTADRTATIAAGTYFLRTDGGGGSNLADAIETALDGAPSTLITFTTSVYHDQNPANVATQFEMAASGAWTLRNTGTFDLTLVGYDSTLFPIASTADNVNATLSAKCAWVGSEPPASDDLVVRANTVQNRTVGGQVYTSDQGGPYDDRALSFIMMDDARTRQEGNTTDPNASFQTFWEQSRGGTRIELHSGVISAGTLLENMDAGTLIGTYVMSADTASGFRPQRHSPGVALYSFGVNLMEYAA